MVRIPEEFVDKIIDVLVKLAFFGIAAALSPILFDEPESPFIYIWLTSIFLFIALVLRDIITSQRRPFAKRLRNEEEAIPHIKRIISETNSRLCVLSKVGTSVFFAFREYSRLLEKGEAVIQVLIVEPNDVGLIQLMDKIYARQTEVSNRWSHLLSQIQVELDVLFGDKEIDQETYNEVKSLIDSAEGYRNLILASIKMWISALEMANHRLRVQNKPLLVYGLEIRTYNVLPDIKAWISDDRICAVGNYDALHLGRDNPIDIYESVKSHKMEMWQFDNIIAIWKEKFDKAQKIDITISTNSR